MFTSSLVVFILFKEQLRQIFIYLADSVQQSLHAKCKGVKIKATEAFQKRLCDATERDIVNSSLDQSMENAAFVSDYLFFKQNSTKFGDNPEITLEFSINLEHYDDC